jgi:Tol biopolymer transport system component
MSDTRQILERGVGGFAPQPDGYERVLRRRDRKRRRERIAAGGVALAISLAVVAAVAYAVRFDHTTQPTEPSPTSPPAVATLPPGLSLLDPDSGNLTPIPGPRPVSGWPFRLDVSPDGSTIAFVQEVGGLDEIFVMDIEGGEIQQLTFSPISGGSPAWSPSGDQIAFDSLSGAIFFMNADGDAIHHTPAPAGFGMYRGPVWSPDGSQLAFWTVGGPKGIGVFDIATGTTSLLDEEGGGAYPAWSPDGQWIAYARAGTTGFNTSTIWLMHPDGSSQHLLAESLAADVSPRWSPDGRTIAFSQTDDPVNGPEEIAIVDVATGTIRVVARNALDTFDWTPRGDLVVAGFSPKDG